MRLTRLRGEWWMAFEAFDIDFGALDQVVITGKNNHGKSALLDALTWCLFEKVIRPDIDGRSSDQFITDGAAAGWVEVTFKTSLGTEVVVRREKPVGKAQTLSLAVDGASIGEHGKGHTIAITQARIEEQLGLSFEALVAGPVMIQEQAGAFMRAGPSKRKELLADLLGLDVYAKLHKLAKARREAADVEVTVLRRSRDEWAGIAGGRPDAEAAVEEARGALATASEYQAICATRAEDARSSLVEAKAKAEGFPAVMAQLARLEERRRPAPDRIASLRAKLAQATAAAAATEPIFVLPDPVDAESLATASRKLQDARSAREQYIAADGKLAGLKERVRAAESRRQILPTVPCHGEGEYATCRFLTEVPKADDVQKGHGLIARMEVQVAGLRAQSESVSALATTEAQLQEAANKYARATIGAESAQREWATRQEAALGAVAQIEASIDEAETAKVDMDAEWGALQEQATPLREAEAALTERTDALAEATTALDAARRSVAAAEPAVRTTEARLAAIAEAEGRLPAIEVDLAEWVAEHERYQLLEAAWHRDGVPTAVIEHSIPVIEQRANEILAMLPQDLRVTLRTQKPLKGKGMAETLDVVVTIGGHERAYGLISVGGRFRVDLALRLALGQLIAHRSGRSIQTLWLDEPLAGLDEEGLEAVIETISTLSSEFPLVVVVSHHREFSDRFTEGIEVVQEGGVSTAIVT